MICDPVAPAEEVFDGLTDDEDFQLPDLGNITFPALPAFDYDTLKGVPSVTSGDLTEGKVNGSGIFDLLMTSVTAHLDRERAAGRITNDTFAKTYVEFSTAAMSGAIQFLLSKDAAHWNAVTAQAQAKMAMVALTQAQVALEESKLRMALVGYQAANAKVEYARGKMALATARVEFCTAEYQLAEILPKQATLLTSQNLQTVAQTKNITDQTNNLLPEQVRGAKAQADSSIYQLTFQLPKQTEVLTAQVKLTQEQHETQRAQTLDARSDGATVTGVLGVQKSLQNQQIVSYKRDTQIKAARPFIDAWITMKTIDEGTLPPTNFSNASLDQVLTIVRRDAELT
jgi:hypothetical protein